MINTARINISCLIDKYKGHVDTLEWNIKNNKHYITASDLENYRDRVEIYKEVIRDLEGL